MRNFVIHIFYRSNITSKEKKSNNDDAYGQKQCFDTTNYIIIHIEANIEV